MGYVPKPCVQCGELTTEAYRCELCESKYQARRNNDPKRQGYKTKEYRSFPKDGCKICGSLVDLRTHHIDHDTNNNSADNLVCLCDVCHRALHNKQWARLNSRAAQ